LPLNDFNDEFTALQADNLTIEWPCTGDSQFARLNLKKLQRSTWRNQWKYSWYYVNS